MDRVLIVDAELTHAATLADALHGVSFHAAICRDYQTAVDVLEKQGADFVLMVPRSSSWWRNDLKSFCDAIRHIEPRPEIVCVLRWSANGPNDRLFGNELNVVVLHER
jgi:DNA-binding response OmpR family regulator